MKAIVCQELSQKLVLTDFTKPSFNEHQILIKSHFCGITFPDWLMVQGKYQFQPPLPFVVGGEVAGIVEEIGKNVTNIKKGDRVVANVRFGAFAEYVVSENFRTFPIQNVPFEQAAAMPTNYGTAFYALTERANLQPNEYLAILGASGGVGMAAIQIGKILGAKIIAIASNDEKLAVCKQNGADFCLNLTNHDLKTELKKITDGKGVDVVLDLVGGNYSELLVRSMARNGRFLVTGFVSGEIPKIPLNLVLLKACQLVGVFWTDFVLNNPEKSQEHFQKLIAYLQNGQIKPPIYQIFGMEQINEAFQVFSERKIVGKILLDMRFS